MYLCLIKTLSLQVLFSHILNRQFSKFWIWSEFIDIPIDLLYELKDISINSVFTFKVIFRNFDSKYKEMDAYIFCYSLTL